MTKRSIRIVGAGLSGPSTGCCAPTNGYRAAILAIHAAMARALLPGRRWSQTGPGLKIFCLMGQRSQRIAGGGEGPWRRA